MMGKPSTGVTKALATKIARAALARAQGKTWLQIADELDYASAGAAHLMMVRYPQEWAKSYSEAHDALLAEKVNRALTKLDDILSDDETDPRVFVAGAAALFNYELQSRRIAAGSQVTLRGGLSLGDVEDGAERADRLQRAKLAYEAMNEGDDG